MTNTCVLLIILQKVLMQKFFERQEASVKNVIGRATERTKQTNRRQKEESQKKVLPFCFCCLLWHTLKAQTIWENMSLATAMNWYSSETWELIQGSLLLFCSLFGYYATTHPNTSVLSSDPMIATLCNVFQVSVLVGIRVCLFIAALLYTAFVWKIERTKRGSIRPYFRLPNFMAWEFRPCGGSDCLLCTVDISPAFLYQTKRYIWDGCILIGNFENFQRNWYVNFIVYNY